MLDFEIEVIEFKFKDKIHKLYRPTNKKIKQYQVDLAKCESNEDKELALIVFLGELGLEKEVYEELNPNQVKKLISAIYESEKN